MTKKTHPNDDSFRVPQTSKEIEKILNELHTHRLDMESAKDQRIRAAIYSRKSRIEPGKVHYSMEIQPDRAEAYAHSQGWEIVSLYADPNKTGRNSKRKELQRLIRDIKSNRIDVVVIHRLDRLYRNLIALLKFIQLINQYNVRLVSVTEQIDTDSPWGRLVVYVLWVHWLKCSSYRPASAPGRAKQLEFAKGCLTELCHWDIATENVPSVQIQMEKDTARNMLIPIVGMVGLLSGILLITM